MAEPKLVPEEQQRLTLDQEIERALENHLGPDYKNNPNIEAIRAEVRKNLVLAVVQTPELYNDRKSLSVVLSYFVQQADKLTPDQQHSATPLNQNITNLKRDCETLIKQLENKDAALATKLTAIYIENAQKLTPKNPNEQEKAQALQNIMTMHMALENISTCMKSIEQLGKQDAELANKLTKTLIENAPKLTSQDPAEKAQAQETINTMQMLLEDFKKTGNKVPLENFATNPEAKDANRPVLGKSQKTEKEIENELTETDKANIALFGAKPETGTHQQQATNTSLRGLVLAIVTVTAMPILVENAEPEQKSTAPSPFHTKPEPKGTKGTTST